MKARGKNTRRRVKSVDLEEQRQAPVRRESSRAVKSRAQKTLLEQKARLSEQLDYAEQAQSVGSVDRVITSDESFGPGIVKNIGGLRQFRARITQGFEGTPVLKNFFEGANSTATWVNTYFPFVELEVHQILSLTRAGELRRELGDANECRPSLADVRTRHFFLGSIATDTELRRILEDPAAAAEKPKRLTAEIFSRFLRREVGTILKWSQRKK